MPPMRVAILPSGALFVDPASGDDEAGDGRPAERDQALATPSWRAANTGLSVLSTSASGPSVGSASE
jgi:hypothetical protein